MDGVGESIKATILDFQKKANDFTSSLEDLKKREGEARRHPQFSEQYDSLINKSGYIVSTVGFLTSAINKAVDYFGIDLEGDGLGALPLVPIAAIAASIAVMGKWVSDVYIFRQRLNEVRRLEAGGMDPRRAAEIAIKRDPGILASLGDNIFKPLVPISIIAAGFWFWHKYGK